MKQWGWSFSSIVTQSIVKVIYWMFDRFVTPKNF